MIAHSSVVVTGAASGIGRAVAERLHRHGRGVVLVDRDSAGVAELAELLGIDVIAVPGDIGERATHQQALSAALELGRLDAWVNCAGLTRPCPLPDLDPAEAARTVDVNLYGTLWGTQTAVASWLSSGTSGAIVNISSVHGRRAYPDHAVYEMSKAAIEALTRSVAVSYAYAGIRANAVAPGAVRTPALEASLDSAPDSQAALAELTAFIPAGRLAEVEEVAAAVEYLLSDEATYVNGHTLVIDGAMTSHIGFMEQPAAKRRA